MSHYFFKDTVTFQPQVLQDWVSGIFQAVCMSREDANLVARTLVESDARGVHSHGCLRVGLYVTRIEKQCVNPAALQAYRHGSLFAYVF